MDQFCPNFLESFESDTSNSDSPSIKRIKLDRSLSSHSVLSDTNSSAFDLSNDDSDLTLEGFDHHIFESGSSDESSSPAYDSSSNTLDSSGNNADSTNSTSDMVMSSLRPSKYFDLLDDSDEEVPSLREILKPTQPQICFFEQLSDEIIVLIFRFLSKKMLFKCSLVSKRWNRLINDDSLWTKLDCFTSRYRTGDLGRILNKQPIFLRLAGSEFPEPAILPSCRINDSEFFLRLVYLDLGMSYISNETLSRILAKCYRLRKLSLEFCTVDETICASISKMYRTLEVLNFAMAKGLNNSSVVALFERPFLQLKELNLAWSDLSIESISFICNNLTESLDRLNISGCKKRLRSSHLTRIVQNSPNLRELDLSDCTQLKNSIYKDIAKLKELHFLALSRCYEITTIDSKIIESLPYLKYLDIHGMPSLLEQLDENFKKHIEVNKFLFSSVARPTVGTKSRVIWGVRLPA